jgi:hypothetical protein
MREVVGKRTEENVLTTFFAVAIIMGLVLLRILAVAQLVGKDMIVPSLYVNKRVITMGIALDQINVHVKEVGEATIVQSHLVLRNVRMVVIASHQMYADVLNGQIALGIIQLEVVALFSRSPTEIPKIQVLLNL